jgi:hypothetical protein
VAGGQPRHPGPNGYPAIGYLLSYHFDSGVNGTGLPYDHAGDSEFLIVKLFPGGSSWSINKMTFSAHWGTLTNHTQTLLGSALEYDSSNHPVSYVSWGKHANYKNEAACDANPIEADCSAREYTNEFMFSLVPDRNIGNAQNPFDLDTGLTLYPPDCTRSEQGFPGIECYFSDNVSFKGWYTYYYWYAGPYKDILQFYSLY